LRRRFAALTIGDHEVRSFRHRPRGKKSVTAKRGPAARPSARELERSELYSEELGIELKRRRDAEYFRWFLASILFGARISETIAKHTYQAFMRYGLASPRKILDAGWDFLVYPVMREGGYVRYDGRKSTQILRDCETLIEDYQGKLSRLEATAQTNAELEARLTAFYGVGPTTANIFLRELRPYWKAADPEPLPAVFEMARRFGVDLSRYNRKSVTFTRVEAGLLRRRHAR
jgi:endonuclease III